MYVKRQEIKKYKKFYIISSSDTIKFHKLFILCCINGDNNVQRGQ